MCAFHTVQLKDITFDMLEPAKKEFLRHHPDWKSELISNNKINYEALNFYLIVESGNKR